METIPEITIEAVIDRYEVLLLDAVGVLVHGSGALAGAVELIQRLNRSAKPYYVLTNDASRLPAARAARLQAYGLAVDADRIITSRRHAALWSAQRGVYGMSSSRAGGSCRRPRPSRYW